MTVQSFVDTLNELMNGSGISNNELARRIGIDAAQVGRWRKGRGRPRPENLVRAAAVFGVDYQWLWSLAYPEGVPPPEPAEDTLDPRLSAFLAEIELGWRAMDTTARDMAERATRAVFRVEDVRAVPPSRRHVTKDESALGIHNDDLPFQTGRSYRSDFPKRWLMERLQSVATPA